MNLLPCPFCGSGAKLRVERATYDKTFKRWLYVAEIRCNMEIICNASMYVVIRGKRDAKQCVSAHWNQRASSGGGGAEQEANNGTCGTKSGAQGHNVRISDGANVNKPL